VNMVTFIASMILGNVIIMANDTGVSMVMVWLGLIFVQGMTWCHKASSHILNKC